MEINKILELADKGIKEPIAQKLPNKSLAN